MAEMSLTEKIYLGLYAWQAFFTLEWSLLDTKMNIVSLLPLALFGPHKHRWLVWKLLWLLQHWNSSTQSRPNFQMQMPNLSVTINWLKWNFTYTLNAKYCIVVVTEGRMGK